MRGSSQETGGKQGYAFFFHKGNLGKVNQKHFVKCLWDRSFVGNCFVCLFNVSDICVLSIGKP